MRPISAGWEFADTVLHHAGTQLQQIQVPLAKA